MAQDYAGQAGSVKIVDANGVRATVRDLASNDALNVALVDANGNQITTFGGASMTDDGAFTVGTSSVNPAGYLADDTATDTVDEGDIGAPRMDLSRRTLVRLVGATDTNRADVDASGHLQVDIAASSVTLDTELPAATALTDNTANPTVPGVGAFLMGYDRSGAAWDRVLTSRANPNAGGLAPDGALVVSPAVWDISDGVIYQKLGANALGDAASGKRQEGVVGYFYNGATYDRMRGDTTNGLDVDVTRVSGNVTVVGTGTFAVQAAQSGTWTVQPGNTANTTAWLVDQENLHEADFDSGAGTQNRAAVGLIVPASGGAAVVPGDTTNGLDVDVTRVQGTVTVGTHDVGSITTAVVPGTGATNLGKAEDAIHNTGDVGVMVLGVRDDTLSVFSGAENDYEPFHMTSTGRLYTSATIDAALPAGTNNIGDVDVVSQVGAANFATGQVSVGTTATQIAATRATRRAILIVNHGTTEVFLGGATVTTTTGLKLEGVDGAAASLPITGAIYGIVASGSQTVSFMEVYD